jgi:hypothetical protein
VGPPKAVEWKILVVARDSDQLSWPRRYFRYPLLGRSVLEDREFSV